MLRRDGGGAEMIASPSSVAAMRTICIAARTAPAADDTSESVSP
jgi:hypothetical protein